MLWLAWGYWRILVSPHIPKKRLLIARFLRVDWNVLHGHSPAEISVIVSRIFRCADRNRGTFIEAGCWNGGSSAKFSILCNILGYRLHVYDSFQGVEDVRSVPGEWDYTGQYAAAERSVIENIRHYGEVGVCETHAGWFSETMCDGVPGPVRVAYIDCDIAKGTREALVGITRSLAPDALVFSQDFHITPVRQLIERDETWNTLGTPKPTIRQLKEKLGVLTW
jgi:O-methyltransferase